MEAFRCASSLLPITTSRIFEATYFRLPVDDVADIFLSAGIMMRLPNRISWTSNGYCRGQRRIPGGAHKSQILRPDADVIRTMLLSLSHDAVGELPDDQRRRAAVVYAWPSQIESAIQPNKTMVFPASAFIFFTAWILRIQPN